MVKVLDVERLGIPVVALPGAGGEMPRGSCAACETYRPDPRPDGSLLWWTRRYDCPPRAWTWMSPTTTIPDRWPTAPSGMDARSTST